VDRKRDRDGDRPWRQKEVTQSRGVHREPDDELEQSRGRGERHRLAQCGGQKREEKQEQGDEDPQAERPAPSLNEGEEARRRIAVRRAAAGGQDVPPRLQLQEARPGRRTGNIRPRQHPVAPHALPGQHPLHVRPRQPAVADHQHDTAGESQPKGRRVTYKEEEHQGDEQEEDHPGRLEAERARAGGRHLHGFHGACIIE